MFEFTEHQQEKEEMEERKKDKCRWKTMRQKKKEGRWVSVGPCTRVNQKKSGFSTK